MWFGFYLIFLKFISQLQNIKTLPQEVNQGGILALAAPAWALLELCTILGEIGATAHVPAIGQRASIRHVKLLFELSSYDQFEDDIHQRIQSGCTIVSYFTFE